MKEVTRVAPALPGGADTVADPAGPAADFTRMTETATAEPGRAVRPANASENADTAKLLAKVVDVVDAATGTVRLGTKVQEADETPPETRSAKAVRVRK